MNLKDELIKYFDAGYPIIYIHSFEEIKTDKIIRRAAGGRKILEWNDATGFTDFKTKTQLLTYKGLEDTLELLTVDDELDRKLLVIKDALPYLEQPRILALLKNICHRIENGLDTAIVIVAPLITVPKSLEKFITILEMEYLTEKEITAQIKQFAEEQNETISDTLLEKMSLAFKGLSEFEIENLLASSIATEGSFSDENLKLILEQKRQMIMKSNVLEMITVTETIDSIGGLANLKRWLDRKANIFKNINRANEYGVDMPKGVLMAGVPGCGKSLAAKATSQLFEVPLLRLDMGRIMGKYLGESETNMHNAISLAEAISPCILWVDELEKAFAGASGSGHEVTVRLFGTLLTWLQEKKSPVFVVATANDISKLPPELLRKGRFDDIFYVSLPNEEERKKIFEIHICKRRPQDISKIDISKIAKETDGYSGADIEGVVIEAVETAFCQNKPSLTTEIISDTVKNTKSLSELLGEKLDELVEYYKDNNYKSASD